MECDINYTPLQRKMVEVFSDGQLHHWRELADDPLSSLESVKVQITGLRKALPSKHLIYCHRAPNGPFYQLIKSPAQ